MRAEHHITLVIPTLNEAEAIGQVLRDIPQWVDDIVVADNNSSDDTREIARQHGARITRTERRGYGSTCLGALATVDTTDIVVFMDGDASCRAEEMTRLVDPICRHEADIVIGSRVNGAIEPGAMTLAQRWGNAFACFLIRRLWDVDVSDLGPYRAIRWQQFTDLDMSDPDFGWTVELQLKAVEAQMRMMEVPVSCLRRTGQSKVSGTVSGVIGAGRKIIGLILRHGQHRIRPSAR